MTLSSALALTVGVILLVLSLAKLGFLSDFLAKLVMTGYVFGVAGLIAMSQLPKVFGVSGGDGNFFEQLRQLIYKLPETNLYSLALGMGTIILIFVLRRFKPMIPGALVALILGIVVTSYFDLNALYGVSIVGNIPSGMPAPVFPFVSLEMIPVLIAGAAGIVFLAVGETLGTARTFAAKYHYEVDADQELLAMGAANISSGMFQGITIDMSLSSTASGEAAGERTQLSIPGQRRRHSSRCPLSGAAAEKPALGGAWGDCAQFNSWSVQCRRTQALLCPAQDRLRAGDHGAGGCHFHGCDDGLDPGGHVVAGHAALPRQPALHCGPG